MVALRRGTPSFRARFRCIIIASAVAAALPAVAACSGVNQAQEERQFIANSFGEVIDNALGNPHLQEFDREVLERAKKTGRIEQADYDEAYDRFRQCMEASGEPVKLKKFSNGLYRVDTTPLSEGESLDSAMEVVTECSDGTIAFIADLYGVQQGNPKLLANPNKIAYECLETKGLVGPEFSLEAFTDALSKPGEPGVRTQDRVPFDLYGDEAQGCLIGANMTYSKAMS